MSYFKELPVILYQFPDNVVRQYNNLSFKPAVIQRVIQDASNFITYTIQDGDTPDTIANDYYGDPTLHWVVLLTNNINNYYTQWPKSAASFNKYLEGKYRRVLDSEGNVVTLTDEQLDILLAFTGEASQQWTSTLYIDSEHGGPSLVRLRPQYFTDIADNIYTYDQIANNPDPRSAWGNAVPLPANPLPVSIYSVEDGINSALRGILLLRQDVVSEIRNELRQIANGQ